MNKKRIEKLLKLLKEFHFKYDCTQIGFDYNKKSKIEQTIEIIENIKENWITYFWKYVNRNRWIIRMTELKWNDGL